MPDISMCLGKGCPDKKKCYRYTATPDPHWQAYGNFEELRECNKCRYFWPNKNYRGIPNENS